MLERLRAIFIVGCACPPPPTRRPASISWASEAAGTRTGGRPRTSGAAGPHYWPLLTAAYLQLEELGLTGGPGPCRGGVEGGPGVK
jgi:hypothetical protein